MYADTDRQGKHQLMDLNALEFCTIDAALERYIEYLEATKELIQGNDYTNEQLRVSIYIRERIKEEILNERL